MADIAKVSTVDMANIAKVYSVDVANIALIDGAVSIPPTPASSWASWDETSEAGIASDNIYVCMMENTSASTNETGQGGGGAGLTGSDLVLTQVGGIPGATGSPPSRSVAIGDGFDPTTAAADAIVTGTDYTIIMKCHTIGSNYSIGELYGTRGHMAWGYTQMAGLYTNGGGGSEYFANASSQPPASGDFYVFLTSKSGKALYSGWNATKPLDISSITSTQRVNTTVRNWSSGSWNSRHSFGSRTAPRNTAVYVYYVIMTQSEIITMP